MPWQGASSIASWGHCLRGQGTHWWWRACTYQGTMFAFDGEGRGVVLSVDLLQVWHGDQRVGVAWGPACGILLVAHGCRQASSEVGPLGQRLLGACRSLATHPPPPLLFPAGCKNLEVYTKQLRCLGLWRAQVRANPRASRADWLVTSLK